MIPLWPIAVAATTAASACGWMLQREVRRQL
jgi:outer membrane lipopolysaccharide assembly protein LptE/RlpB